MTSILVVDDNAMNRKMILHLLKSLQVQTDIAENGRIALDKIREHSYDLILMDHMMPVMDGVEAVKQLRIMDGGRYSKLPVIALSAGGQPGAEALFAEAGMNGHMAKPIIAENFYELLERWLPEVTDLDAGYDVGEQLPMEQLTEEALPRIEGMDVQEGIRYLGGLDFWEKQVGTFYQMIDMKNQKIVQCLRDNLIKDYVIEVHALKNTARMIGALRLSEEFAHLEQLGNAGDITALLEKTPGVMANFLGFKQKLEIYGVRLNQSLRQVSTKEILFYLQGIQDAIAGGNLQCMDDALSELEKCQMPTSCQMLMNDLRAYVADVDRVHVTKTVSQLMDMIGTGTDK